MFGALIFRKRNGDNASLTKPIKTTDLYLERIKLVHFKNYTQQELHFSSGLNCIVGLNGMGKTNLLDAIYYLCMAKSSFHTPDRQVMQHEADFFRLEGDFVHWDQRERIVAKVMPRKRKEFERNGHAYRKLSEHIGLLPVVFIAPDDTYLVREGSEGRRRFINNTLSQMDAAYLNALIRYNQLLARRNQSLKQMAADNRFDDALLDAYDQQMISPATIIHQKRAAFIRDFLPYLQKVVEQLVDGREAVSCQYQTKLEEQDFGRLLQLAREKDRLLQRTTVGIHRDDLEFTLAGRPLKRFGSQGQVKSFVLGLKLAQYALLKNHKPYRPILLLDDIFDKLDDQRVASLIELLVREQFGQAFITDTHDDRLEQLVRQFGMDYCKFRVQEGNAIPASASGTK